MPISEEQKQFYESVMENTRREIQDIDAQIEEEMAKVRERLAELQNGKAAAQQMYAAACLRLGIPNDMEEEEEGEA
ncbi:MAG TPA: hypothetical protein PK014_02495 [Thermoanaerobaculia bacterium]|nr:hypothetical protein [Thermoanaerobaculia bacterium]HUM28897.1 hypothetical protein [Thermoanaerobaculia bacterium]HXK67170.1 hypothetical protein [Thermoanaerobaculia bacterium]